MNLVMNEYEWVDKALREKALGKSPYETMNRMGKVLSERYGKHAARKMLDEFLLQCDKNISLVSWSNTLDRIIKNADRHKVIKVDYIPVSDTEMDTIDRLNGRQLQRLAFTLLCVSKYWDSVSDTNNGWVNAPDTDIVKMANINTSIKRQSLMYGQLKDLGLIKFSKRIDNLNVQVLFSDNNEPVLRIHDLRNLGYQYLKFHGEPYFECENCGITVKIQEPNKGRKPKYCKECAAAVHTAQKVNSVMRHRGAIRN